MPLISDDAPDMVRPPKTAELIAGYLRTRIVRGDLPPDAALPGETQLMAQFGVSRPTLREAFRILETESLIVVKRGVHGGPRVTSPDPAVAARSLGALLQLHGNSISDVYAARKLLEPPCARVLAMRRTVTDLADLQACIDRLNALLDEDAGDALDRVSWSNATHAFHALILERSGNKTVAILGGVLAEIVRMHLQVTVRRSQQDASALMHFRRATRSYEKLLRLIEAGDGDAAEAHWTVHLEAASRTVISEDRRPNSVVNLFG